jgi:hypothetical protein
MSQFTEDVQLLGDLQALITEAEKTANMTPAAQMVVKMAVPKAKDLLPEAQSRARRQIEVITRAKTRLAELMEADRQK